MTPFEHRQSPGARWSRLIAVWGAIAVAWLAVLPAIAERPQVQCRLEEWDASGIDPSAMFYSELDAMDGVLARLDRFHRRHPDALWRISQRTGPLVNAKQTDR